MFMTSDTTITTSKPGSSVGHGPDSAQEALGPAEDLLCHNVELYRIMKST